MGGVKRFLGKKAHLESCRGTEYDNQKYCTKDGKYQMRGKFICQGYRSDLEHVKKIIDSGKNMQQVANENFQLYIQYGRGLEKYKQMVDKVRSKQFRKVEVIVHSGRTGTGKTRDAMKQADYKINGPQLQWWDGYEGEKCICIDEYNNDVGITELLTLLDGYQLRLPIKGGFTYAQWDKVYITTNLVRFHKNAKKEHREALRRRITTWKKYAKVP